MDTNEKPLMIRRFFRTLSILLSLQSVFATLLYAETAKSWKNAHTETYATRTRVGHPDLHFRPYVMNNEDDLRLPLVSSGELDEPQMFRVLAIRVDFLPDTLKTTTGNGSFYLVLPDTIEADDWKIDPPPHDRRYFQDQLLAAKNYFTRFSRGNAVLTGKNDTSDDSGGDVYPSNPLGAYRMPYPIWHVNYGNIDDPTDTRLDSMLTRLFYDAWTIADQTDTSIIPLDASDYDVFVVFHAGAGNEFDTGFDLTPHDIPSVYIDSLDLATHLGLMNGIELSNGARIKRGVILPEMQRQWSIEIGMMGTVCAQLGFLIGMPHLYQPVVGNPSIGLFGLMDRGFGGYFGIIPTPPCAWMRLFKGWEDTLRVRQGKIRLGALQLSDEFMQQEGLNRLVSVPINNDEYYLLEARMRRPRIVTGNSRRTEMTVAYDRAGRQMRLFNDYSVEVDPGFRVPISVEDYEFDLPLADGKSNTRDAGILIWHIDDSVIQAKINHDAIQEDRNHRGVDLEEADGSEDLGEDYPFLSPGDGSEYGIREDAFYAGNELWRLANRESDISFGAGTVPSTRAYSGGESHLLFYNFSPSDSVMSCWVINQWIQGNFPPVLPGLAQQAVDLNFISADFDGDGLNDLVFYNRVDSLGTIWIFHGDGTPFPGMNPFQIDCQIQAAAAANLDDDEATELVFLSNGREPVMTPSVILLNFSLESPELPTITTFTDLPAGTTQLQHLLIAGEEGSPHLVLVSTSGSESFLVIINADFQSKLPEVSLPEVEIAGICLLGGEWSDTIGMLARDGTLFTYNISTTALSPDDAGSFEIADPNSNEGIKSILAADLDGDDHWEIIANLARTNDREVTVWWEAGDPAEGSVEHHSFEDGFLIFSATDIDADGVIEPVGWLGADPIHAVAGLEPAGIWSEGTPIRIYLDQDLPYARPLDPMPFPQGLLVDLHGNGEKQLIYSSGNKISAISLKNGRGVEGFSLDVGFSDVSSPIRLLVTQLDGDDDLEMAVLSTNTGGFKVFNIFGGPFDEPEVIWGMEGGNSRRTNHLWTPSAIPYFAPGLDVDHAYCWPNPVVEGTAHFRFRTDSSGMAELRVFDLVGREVANLRKAHQAQRENEIELDCETLPSGIYTARLEAAGKHTLIRFAVVQ